MDNILPPFHLVEIKNTVNGIENSVRIMDFKNILEASLILLL